MGVRQITDDSPSDSGSARYAHFDHNEAQESLDRIRADSHTNRDFLGGQPFEYVIKCNLLALREPKLHGDLRPVETCSTVALEQDHQSRLRRVQSVIAY